MNKLKWLILSILVASVFSCAAFRNPEIRTENTAAVELDKDSNQAIDINLGGTNAKTASLARANLGAQASNTNLDAISALTDVTDPSTTEQGIVRKATNSEIQNGSTVPGFLDPGQAKLNLDTLADLASYTGPQTTIYIKGRTSEGDGGQGVWVLTAGDFTSELAADALNGIYLEYSGEDGSTRAWVRQYQIIMPEYFGGGSGYAVDNLQATLAAVGFKNTVKFGSGVWRFSGPLVLSASEEDSVILQGAGEAQTVLVFEGTSGVELNGSALALRDLTIIDSNAYTNPVTTLEIFNSSLPQRANITSSTTGLLIARSHIKVDNVQVMGFDSGIFFGASKFYNSVYNCRSHYNLKGVVVGSATLSPNLARAHACYFSNNFGMNLHAVNGSIVLRDVSLEGCVDYDADNPNFPNGGVLIEEGAQVLMDNPYLEGCNFYNFDRRTAVENFSNSTYMVAFAPFRVGATKYGDSSNNLILPPHLRSWTPQSSTTTIDNTTTYISEGKRYNRITASGGAGVDKRLFSHWNTDVQGLTPLATANAFFKVYAGMWVRLVSGSFTADEYPFLRVQFQDTSSNVYYGESRSRTTVFDTDGFDNTALGVWQYIGAFYQVRYTNATGNPLEQLRLELNIEDASVDLSVTNNVLDISEPEIRLFYQTPGNIINLKAEPTFNAVTELTISSGTITVVDHYHTVDTESDAASDDLSQINGEDLYVGFELTLSAADSGRTVVVKDGTGNINLEGAGVDFSLDNASDKLKLVWNGTSWASIAQLNNGS